MKIIIRMHRNLFEVMQHDLHRVHEFAGERVGFLSARSDEIEEGGKIILVNGYHPVRDEHYIRDDSVGARISGDAIREAMQRTLDSGDCAIHVHFHPDRFPIGFSRSDVRGYAGLIPALMRVGPQQLHGAIVLNSNAMHAAIWMKGVAEPMVASGLSVVGFPFSFIGGVRHG